MRRLVKRLAALFLVPLFQWYLRRERVFRYNDIRIRVMPGVFHPGFFFSTRFLLQYLTDIDLSNKRFLELGSGTGLISIFAARRGSMVTASDLSTKAVGNTKTNAALNNTVIETVFSDLFTALTGKFDIIVVNPPYYAKPVTRESELAWHSGEDHLYFKKFFGQLGAHIHDQSQVIMVLTKGCDMHRIFEIARQTGFEMDLLRERNVFFDEKDFLYGIRPVNSFVSTQV